jgi:ATP-dependent protease ClpP protease subunit
MNDLSSLTQAPPELARPQVRLNGPVDDAMLRTFLDALAAAEDGQGPVVLEMTSTGGDAEVGRRIAADVRLFRERTGRRTLFFGKANVYSAAVTVMSAFPRADRWLARESTLLIHCRQLRKTVEFDGPLKGERARAEAVLSEIENGIEIEREGFERLIDGSSVSLHELEERAVSNWYVDAEEALQRGLVAGVV